MTLKTRTWEFHPWELTALKVIASWPGDHVNRATLRNAVRIKVPDPSADNLAGPGANNGRKDGGKTWLDRRIINLLIMLDRAGLIDRDDHYIQIRDRAGMQTCIDAGWITYSWEKADNDH